MAEIVGVKVQLEGGEAIKTVGSLRQQLKASLTDLQNMQAQFGDISPQAIEAAKAVAGLRDSIKDANEVSSLFDPEKKFQAVVGVAQGIASGFAAAQGAMALFGAESKEVEQALLKVQATMALAQGLSGLKAAAEDFKRLGALIQTTTIYQKGLAAANAVAAATMRAFGIATETTSFAFKALRAAIVTTGIGALVVGIGLLVNKMMEWSDATDEQADAQQRLNEKLEKEKELAREIAAINLSAINRQEQLDAAKAKQAGKSEAEINKIHEDAAAKRLAILYEAQSKEKAGTAAFDAAQEAANQESTKQELDRINAKIKAQEEAEDAAEKAAEKSKVAREKAAAHAKATDEKIAALSQQNIETIKQQGEEQRRAAKEAEDAEDAARAARIDKSNEEQDAQTQREKEHAEARTKVAQAEADSKIMAAQAVAGALNGFAALAGEQTAAGKAFAVASATIQAILGAQQAFTAMSAIPVAGPALGVIAAAGAIAAGIANVKKILSVQVPGQSGGGTAPNLSGITGAAPLTPQRPQTATTRLDQDTVNNIGSAVPARAYVLESDITNSQSRMNRIRNAAKFE